MPPVRRANIFRSRDAHKLWRARCYCCGTTTCLALDLQTTNYICRWCWPEGHEGWKPGREDRHGLWQSPHRWINREPRSVADFVLLDPASPSTPEALGKP